jgi:hypothetical protein
MIKNIALAMTAQELKPIGDCILRDFTSDHLAYRQSTEDGGKSILEGIVQRVWSYVQQTEPDALRKSEKLQRAVQTLEEINFPEAALAVMEVAKRPLVQEAREALHRDPLNIVSEYLEPREVDLYMPEMSCRKAFVLYEISKRLIEYHNPRIEQILQEWSPTVSESFLDLLRYELMRWCLTFDQNTLEKLVQKFERTDWKDYDPEHVARLEADLRGALKFKDRMMREDAKVCAREIRDNKLDVPEQCSLLTGGFLPSEAFCVEYKYEEVAESDPDLAPIRGYRKGEILIPMVLKLISRKSLELVNILFPYVDRFYRTEFSFIETLNKKANYLIFPDLLLDMAKIFPAPAGIDILKQVFLKLNPCGKEKHRVAEYCVLAKTILGYHDCEKCREFALECLRKATDAADAYLTWGYDPDFWHKDAAPLVLDTCKEINFPRDTLQRWMKDCGHGPLVEYLRKRHR